MAEYQDIIYEIENMVATITLNRPERMNALTIRTYNEIDLAIKAADEDDDVRAVIITGAGRGFCSGDDVKEMPDPIDSVRIDWESGGHESIKSKIPSRLKPLPLLETLMNFEKPLIAAVNGAAVGWGMGLTLPCDFRYASENAKFGEVYILRGLMADFGGLLLLPRIVGLPKANELLLTGDIINADEAEKIGLVNKTVPHEELLPVAMAMAEKLASLPPVAVRMTKEGIRRGLDYNIAAMAEYQAFSNKALFNTEDFKEASTTLLDGRKPEYKGR